MTQEEKAKAYDEAKQRAKHALDCDRNGLVSTDKSLIFSMFPELAESEDERVRKFLVRLAERCPENSIDFMGEIKKKDVLSWLERQGEKKPAGYDNLAELAEGEVTTADGITEDMMSLRIEHTPLSSRAKNLLRYQFDTIGDMVSCCDGKWRRLRGLRNLGKVTYNEIMEYLGIDDRL